MVINQVLSASILTYGGTWKGHTERVLKGQESVSLVNVYLQSDPPNNNNNNKMLLSSVTTISLTTILYRLSIIQHLNISNS